jgi:hypothetical protein
VFEDLSATERERLLAGPAALAGSERCSMSRCGGHRDFKGGAYLTHPVVAEPAEAFDENPDRNTLDRIKVDG